jgi:quercetin dioxygenase-like cupin family protein
MGNRVVGKAKRINNVNIIDYISNSIVSKTILKKITGKVCVLAFDSGESYPEKVIPFDTFIQIIEGKAEIIIDGVSNFITTGHSIIIPEHSSQTIKAVEQFKMISTVIKSGYE